MNVLCCVIKVLEFVLVLVKILEGMLYKLVIVVKLGEKKDDKKFVVVVDKKLIKLVNVFFIW